MQYVESYLHKASSDGQNNLLRNPSILPPTIKDFEEINKDLGLRLTEQELNFFVEYHKETTETYERVNELLEDPLPVKYPRTSGHRETENPAWYWRCDIKGAPSGILAGKTVAIKDNIAVAGIPMMNGSKMLEGYTPEFDATIVTRILDAGGHIMGKATCEDMCFSGSSWTCCTGPVPNPYDPTRTAGGSSCGSGSLVAHGVVDMAIGGDQGGSIRIPACWCGIVGLKPSFGLVPYTGICPIEIGIDHTGPMTRTVTDCARLLEAIAGYDEGRDVRQHPAMTIPKYSVEVESDVSKKVVGILKEGFKEVEEGYAKVVKEAAQRFKECGITVKEVSMPLHDDGLAIWTPIAYEGTYKTMIQGNGGGYNWKGIHGRSMQEFLAARRNLRPGDQAIACKSVGLFSEYMDRNYQNKFYSKAQNLTWKLTREYNKLLKECDVLVMPTLTGLPFKLPTKDDPLSVVFKKSFSMIKNTAPFDVTGHPAMTINAGYCDGLPCGMMIVGRLFDDLTVLQVARAFEKLPKEK
ncbi:hypothetical protein FSP39_009856 [Pinctada imbricata]|uniref:Amidase domain-containing protein n=1 Tax=Pinctada imbricata TaxID=66713 RepID=A0AA89CAC4_PINIB|nr:hypothetical protein FSP39_009856 [Pinctada imbricata]